MPGKKLTTKKAAGPKPLLKKAHLKPRFSIHRILAREQGSQAFRTKHMGDWRTTSDRLSALCRTRYGRGEYVALEKPERPDGRTISYWFIRVTQTNHGAEQFVIPIDKWLRTYLKRFDRNWAERNFARDEPAIAATEIKIQLRERAAERAAEKARDEIIPPRQGGRNPSPEVDDALEWWKDELPKEEIIKKLVQKYGTTIWSALDTETKEQRANTALESAKRWNRDQKQKTKVKKS